MGPKQHVTPKGMKVLLWGLVILIVMNIMGRFDFLPVITSLQSDILTLVAALFIATEIGMMSVLKNRKFTAKTILGIIIVGVALLAVVLGWFGVAISILEASKSWLDIGLLVYVVWEIFQ